MRVLVTCPPMLGMKDHFIPLLEKHGVEVVTPNVVQTLSEKELIKLVPEFDGWIIGDDPATRAVFTAGHSGKLKAAVKWGIGVDNVDFKACEDLGIPITNTPNMFGEEVADVALTYLIGLARETYYINQEIKNGNWPKNSGISLRGKTVGVIGQGDIGYSASLRFLACGLNVTAWDPGLSSSKNEEVLLKRWPEGIEECDFLVFTCSLNEKNKHMLSKETLKKAKNSVRVVNVARGPLINEMDLIECLKTQKVHSVALDVFEFEPLPESSELREFPLNIFGSHNSSNSKDAVKRTNEVAINHLLGFLGIINA